MYCQVRGKRSIILSGRSLGETISERESGMYTHTSTLGPYLFDLTLLGPDRPHFGRLQIKMIVTSYVNARA